MQGNDGVSRPRSVENPRRTRVVAGALVVILLACLAVLWSNASARAVQQTAPLWPGATTRCGATVEPAPQQPRQINLVLDDSGSMFNDGGGNGTDRWSVAKYSLEVFAAMLEQNDTLAVYRMSDFKDGANPGPTVTLFGTEPPSSRVAKIHEMPLYGYATPYSPVQRATADLLASDAPIKWLVILSDGEFNDRATGEVQADLNALVAGGRTETGAVNVAFMAIGPEAPAIQETPGVHFLQAASSADVLNRMTAFSNVIFGRNVLPQTSAGVISPDIDLSEALVFAQGPSVDIGAAVTPEGTRSPISSVLVSWADNPEAYSGSRTWPAVPNQSLKGEIARFSDLGRGDIRFDLTGAQTVDVFYKPRVDFGVELRDSSGAKVDGDKIVGGDYTLAYGFMDEACGFVESDLLGQVEYSAKVYHDDELVADRVGSGDVVTLDRGDIILDVEARYLGGATSSARINLQVLQPSRPAVIDAEPATFEVSRLGRQAGAEEAIALTYRLDTGPFSAEEWAAVTTDSFRADSAANLEWDVVLGEEIGQVYLIPQAPDGDVYAANTGEIDVSITGSHVFDEQLYEARTTVTITMIDDMPWWERLLHWFTVIGWFFLLLLLLAVLIAGYVFKRRFSRRFSPRPKITGRYSGFGRNDRHDQGKFQIGQIRRFLPFVADVATLKYTPGGSPFPSLRLKAGRSKTAMVENWRDLQKLAERTPVKIGNNVVNDSTKRPPTLNASMRIIAQTPEITYTATLLKEK